MPGGKEKRNEPDSEAVKGGLGIFNPRHTADRRYELLANAQCIYYIIKNRFQCKYAVVQANFLQLYENVFGQAVHTLCRKYIPISGGAGAGHAGACDPACTAFK